MKLAYPVAAAVLMSAAAPITAQSTAAPQGVPVTTGPAGAAEPEPAPGDRIVCRRQAVTGSLVKRERVCHSVDEWRRLSERHNDTARDMVDQNRTRPAGGS